jgi:hypothetical protein
MITSYSKLAKLAAMAFLLFFKNNPLIAVSYDLAVQNLLAV